MHHVNNPDPANRYFHNGGDRFTGTVAELAAHVGCGYSEINDIFFGMNCGENHPAYGWRHSGYAPVTAAPVMAKPDMTNVVLFPAGR